MLLLAVLPFLCTTNLTINIFKPRIVGGDIVVKRKDFSFQVSLRSKHGAKYKHYCGGAILNKHYVVTAAHCCKPSRFQIGRWVKVVAGDLNTIDSTKYTVERWVYAYHSHPSYNTERHSHDICLLRLNKPYNFNTSDTIQPTKLWKIKPPISTVCIISGWGSTIYKGPMSADLRFVTILVEDDMFCKVAYRSSFYGRSMICAGHLAGGKSSCQGDSGGPLMCEGKLAGIVSFGYKCGEPSLPSVYTDISYFKDWIQQILNISNNNLLSKYIYFISVFLSIINI